MHHKLMRMALAMLMVAYALAGGMQLSSRLTFDHASQGEPKRVAGPSGPASSLIPSTGHFPITRFFGFRDTLFVGGSFAPRKIGILGGFSCIGSPAVRKGLKRHRHFIMATDASEYRRSEIKLFHKDIQRILNVCEHERIVSRRTVPPLPPLPPRSDAR